MHPRLILLKQRRVRNALRLPGKASDRIRKIRKRKLDLVRLSIRKELKRINMDQYNAYRQDAPRRHALHREHDRLQAEAAAQAEAQRRTNLVVPTLQTEESEISSAPSTPGPLNEEDGDFFVVQKIESPLSSREGSREPSYNRPKNPVDKLPSEILILILARLSSPRDLLSCLQVSSGWARCCVDLLWHRPLFTTWKKLAIVAESLTKSDAFWPYQNLIRRLNLSNLSLDISDGTLQTFIHCKRVERLTLTGCEKLTDAGVTALIEGNQNLLALDVTGVSSLTDISINALTRNCVRLQGLNITGCKQVSDSSLVPLAEACKYLKRVRLTSTLNAGSNLSS